MICSALLGRPALVVTETPTKQPTPDFVIRLRGGDVRPWSVSARNLARMLEAVQRLIDQSDWTDEPDTEQARAAAVRLIKITTGSAAYACSTPDPEPTLRLLRAIGDSIQRPEKATWTRSMLSSLEDFSSVARSQGCDMEIRKYEKGRNGEVLARIGPQTFDAVSPSAFVRGFTSLFATIERVGGATEMHCGIRLQSQPRKMVICRLSSEDLVRSLGKCIYQDVVLHGDATWFKHDMTVKTLVITGYEDPKTGSLVDMARGLYDSGGSAWDEIEDPDAFLAENRGA